MPEENKGTGILDLPQEGELTINVSDLQKIIADLTKNQIDALRADLLKTDRKNLFPDGDGREVETCGKSIIDSRFFCKSFADERGYDHPGDGISMVERFKAFGGPWKRLSPQMEKFAEVVRCRADLMAMAQKGFDIRSYNEETREFNSKYIKALTTTDAGALVPVEYLATVIEFATAQSRILQRVMRIPMGSLSMRIPKLVQSSGSYFGGLTLYHPDESGLKTDTKPSFDTLTLTAKKLIGLINITDELIADSSINIINYITALFVRAFQYQTEYEIITGSGANNQMLGIRNDPGINTVARTVAGTVQYADLINLESSLDENFTDLTFLSRRATVNTLRTQVDTVGQPVYHDGFTTFLGGAMVPQLLGYPVDKTRNVPAMGVRGDLILGDLSYYIWAVRQDMVIDQSNAPRFVYDETTLRFVMRQDGLPGVSTAFSVLDGTAS